LLTSPELYLNAIGHQIQILSATSGMAKGVRPDARVRPAAHQASRVETMSLWTRRAGVVVLAMALVALTMSVSASGQQVALTMEGNDGMEVDLSTLPRSAQMQDLAHVGGTAMGAGKGQYDDLLSNGPLDPSNSMMRQAAAPSGRAHGSMALRSSDSAQSGSGGIAPIPQVHLLRSAREILAGKMAGALEGHTLSKAQAKVLAEARSRAPNVSAHEKAVPRAVWQPRVKTSLKQRAAELEAKVRKLEDAAGSAEISELDGLSERN